MSTLRVFSKAAPTILAFSLLLSAVTYAQNQVTGQVQITGKTKVDKTSGVWVDGQYVGYVKELKGNKRILLLPGEHEISVRQAGYTNFTQKIIVEPGKTVAVDVAMQKDPGWHFPAVTSEIKLKVTPDRAAVFLDGGYVGTVKEFGGIGRAMLVSPGKHRIKIALPGYQQFETDVQLLPNQKMTVKTDLVAGSITQAGSSIKKD